MKPIYLYSYRMWNKQPDNSICFKNQQHYSSCQSQPFPLENDCHNYSKRKPPTIDLTCTVEVKYYKHLVAHIVWYICSYKHGYIHSLILASFFYYNSLHLFYIQILFLILYIHMYIKYHKL